MVGSQLDSIDQQILTHLTADARIPLATLADRVHLSRNAVRQRVERMERNRVIAGYTVVRGRGDSGSRPVTAIVMVYRADRMRGSQVVSELSQIPEVVRCDVLSGEFDLLVTLQADTMERVGQIWENIAALPGVANTVTAVALSTVIDHAPT